MCTVTFVPTAEGFFLTSSRDEKKIRPTLPPQKHIHNPQNLIYPKDEVAGGTWIACSESKRYACLLNGAFGNHVKKESYRLSRGTVLLHSFDLSIDQFISNIDLTDIEPFTLLLIDASDSLIFWELKWDGFQKYRKCVDVNQFHIWSSATLYTPETTVQREQWFKQWIEKNSTVNDKNIFEFHKNPQSNDPKNDIVMQRNNGLQTVSISQIQFQKKETIFIYCDLINKTQSSTNI